MRRDVGEGAMTKEEVADFCSRYMPSYEAYSQKLNDYGMPDFVSPDRTLKFKLT